MDLNSRKKIVFEGNVEDVVKWIREKMGTHEVLNLRDYFNGQSVWGVYHEGDEKFSYYYECLGRGRYTVFVVDE